MLLHQMRRIWFCCFWIICLSRLFGAEENTTTPEPRQVVLVIWDGMRPDFISEANTPNLWKLREEGVAFSRHHPVFLSSTECWLGAPLPGVPNDTLPGRAFA